MSRTIIELTNISKQFGAKKIIDNFNLIVEDKEFISISGKSGCGKSTLLNLIGLLDKPTAGKISLFGEENVKPFSKKATKILKNEIGYLFQNFALVENETVYYNMKIAIEHFKFKDQDKLIFEALKNVGIYDLKDQKVYLCSGGEQQRLAIARLIVKPCRLILADEPTGSLDDFNKHEIFNLLLKLNEMGKTLLVVTHDQSLVDISQRNIVL